MKDLSEHEDTGSMEDFGKVGDMDVVDLVQLKKDISILAFEQLVMAGALHCNVFKPEYIANPPKHFSRLMKVSGDTATLISFEARKLWMMFLPPERLISSLGIHFEFLGLKLPSIAISGFGLYTQLAMNLQELAEANNMPLGFLSSKNMSPEDKVEVALWQLFDDYEIGPEKRISSFFASKEGIFTSGEFHNFPGTQEEYDAVLDDTIGAASTEPAREFLTKRLVK